ncbi:hypothetical protein BGY98DRAFT_1028362 [Russula aff. rugulosa BPL654]|nr:hypothetical protein BGY98DRAFT_1028362 [Russula aff. rugulosa BPL654]
MPASDSDCRDCPRLLQRLIALRVSLSAIPAIIQTINDCMSRGVDIQLRFSSPHHHHSRQTTCKPLSSCMDPGRLWCRPRGR